ncbi:DUF5671 domain-containing protein [bacterium]|nr:DUF5671 domain-containing protein [bacterium]
MENTKSAKLAFYYSLALVTLIIGAISFGSIIFEFINKFFPLISDNYYSENSGIKSAISGVIIAFPIFYFMKSLIYKGIKKGEFGINSSVRKWMTYFIIFVSSVVMVGALIGLLNNFLDGETTANSILKILTVLVVSSSIFGFYFYDIKSKEINKKFNLAYFIITCFFVLVVLISSFFIIESPAEARARKLDQKIINNFETIKRGLETYYRDNQKLPESLKVLEEQNYSYVDSKEFKEGESEKYYDYKVIEGKRFELCATFNSSSVIGGKETAYNSANWKHDKGYQCIPKTIEETGK